jgi:hypothetical protein
MPEREFSEEEIAEFEKQRALEVSELIKDGAESVADVAHPADPSNPSAKNPNRRWEVTASQMVGAYQEGLENDRNKAKPVVREQPSAGNPEGQAAQQEPQAKTEAPKNPEKSPEDEVREKVAELCSRFEAAFAEWTAFQPELRNSRPDLDAYVARGYMERTQELFSEMKTAGLSDKEVLAESYTHKGFADNIFHDLYQVEQILRTYPSEDPTWHKTLEHVQRITDVVDDLLEYTDRQLSYKDGLLQPARPEDERAVGPMSTQLRSLPELRTELKKRLNEKGSGDIVVATQAFGGKTKYITHERNMVWKLSPRDWAGYI